jgi:hypothetical protein
LFAPVHTPEFEIMKQTLKGSKETYFAIFTFAGSSGIDDTMLALARGGMAIWASSNEARRHSAGPQPEECSTTTTSGSSSPPRHRRAQAPPQADGDRPAGRRRGQLQLHEPANDYKDEKIFVLGSVDPVTSRC